MTELKREYVIPLRRKTILAPKWRRSKKAMSVLKDFIRKHMKTDNVIICEELNEFIWQNGIKNPPGKVEVVALKKQFSDGVERTLVNLVSVGLDEKLKSYEVEMPTQKETKEEEISETNEDKKENLEENKEETTKVKEDSSSKNEEVKEK
jgi:large subunit ribosomal protein L31e